MSQPTPLPAELDRSIEAPVKDIPAEQYLPEPVTLRETIAISLFVAVSVDAVFLALLVVLAVVWSQP